MINIETLVSDAKDKKRKVKIVFDGQDKGHVKYISSRGVVHYHTLTFFGASAPGGWPWMASIAEFNKWIEQGKVTIC